MLWRRRERPEHRRRRLADIEEVEFSVPSEGGIEGEGGEVMTGSQQAAAFVNNMVDPVSDGWDSVPVMVLSGGGDGGGGDGTAGTAATACSLQVAGLVSLLVSFPVVAVGVRGWRSWCCCVLSTTVADQSGALQSFMSFMSVLARYTPRRAYSSTISLLTNSAIWRISTSLLVFSAIQQMFPGRKRLRFGRPSQGNVALHMLAVLCVLLYRSLTPPLIRVLVFLRAYDACLNFFRR